MTRDRDRADRASRTRAVTMGAMDDRPRVSVETPPHRTDYVRPAVVHLAEPDPRWADAFAREAEELERVLGSELVTVEHIGSTAVTNLAAKPIIDILVTVRDWTDVELLVERFSMLGYVHTPHSWADDPLRHVFRKGDAGSGRQPHHVHVTEPDSEYAQRILAFRDYLRSNPEHAADYGELKRRLSEQFHDDPRAYTDAKSTLVRDTERQAGADVSASDA